MTQTQISQRMQAIDTRRFGDAGLVVRLARVARPFLPHLIGMQLLAFMASALVIATPVPLRLAIDSVLGGRSIPGWVRPFVPRALETSSDGALWICIGTFLIIGLLQPIRGLLAALLRTYTSEHLMLRLRQKMFRHAQSLSLGFHDKTGVGDSIYRVQHDAQAIQQLTVNGVIPLVGEGTTLLFMVTVMSAIDWKLTVIALAIAPVLATAAQVYRRHLRTSWQKTKEIESSVLGVVQEVLSALRVVKAFGQEDREESRFNTRARTGIRAKLRAVTLEGTFGVIVGVTTVIGTAIVLYVGIRHVQTGYLTLGELTQIAFYLAMIYRPLEVIGTRLATLQQWMASANRCFALLEERPDVHKRKGGLAIERARGEVEFRHVRFDYGGTHAVLDDISFRAPPGSRVGISGETGSGKTTLISLLTRFYDPTEGAILLDGVDIREYALEDLRRQFAVVLQDSVLFSGSIADNIAYGKPGATHEEIVEAAKLANAHQFISRLADGYDSEVGERGMQVSGGERQRIALARAFLRDSAILILDEPTSSVDVDTEALVMEAIERLMQGRTTFLISHRPNTLDGCDVRLYLDRGRLVDPGAPSA